MEHFFPDTFQLVRGHVKGMPVKPDPAGIHSILQELSAEVDRTVFVGDSDVDVYTGHNGGLSVCGVTWGFRGRQELQSAGADRLADTPEELEQYLLA